MTLTGPYMGAASEARRQTAERAPAVAVRERGQAGAAAPDVLERRRLPARTADAARSRHLTAAVAQGSVDVELDPHGAELDADPAAAVRLPRESEQVG